MKKTEMMKRFEAETGKQALTYIMVHVSVDGYDHGELVPSEEYNNWLEAKATAYDRLMSGGREVYEEDFEEACDGRVQ